MKLFRVQESNVVDYQFDGDYSWCLQAVRCETCRRYRGSYLGCPSLNIRGKLDEKPYKSGSPVPRSRFEELVAPLRVLVAGQWPLIPGMGFGPFLGSVMKREKRDFLWLFGRTILIKESAYETLCREGISLTTGPAVIKNPRGPEVRADYVRVAQVRPVPCMAEKTLEYAEHNRCPGCSLSVWTWPKRLFLKKDSVPEGMDLFAVEGPENIVATERLQEVVQRLGLTNIAFEEVELV